MYNSTQEILRLTTMTKRIILKKIYKTRDFSPPYLGQPSFLQTFLFFRIHHLVDKAQIRLVMTTNLRKYSILKIFSRVCLFNYIYHDEMCLFMIPEKMRLSPKRYSPNSLCFIHLINSVTCWKYPFINLNQLPSSNAHWCVLYICLILLYTVYYVSNCFLV